MRSAVMAFLVGVGLASTSIQANGDGDYLVTTREDGIYVYSVSAHTTRLVKGSPFVPSPVPVWIGTGGPQNGTKTPGPAFIGGDPTQDYLFALYAPVTSILGGGSPGGALYSFRMEHGVPKFVSSSAGLNLYFGGGCPRCAADFNLMAVSRHYVFVSNLNGYAAFGGGGTSISVFRSEHGILSVVGEATKFDPRPPAERKPPDFFQPLSINVDAAEKFAYVSFASQASLSQLVADSVAIYDVECGAFEFVRAVPSTDFAMVAIHSAGAGGQESNEDSCVVDKDE